MFKKLPHKQRAKLFITFLHAAVAATVKILSKLVIIFQKKKQNEDQIQLFSVQ